MTTINLLLPSAQRGRLCKICAAGARGSRTQAIIVVLGRRRREATRPLPMPLVVPVMRYVVVGMVVVVVVEDILARRKRGGGLFGVEYGCCRCGWYCT